MSNKRTMTLYYLASALFYIVAIMKILDTGFSLGVVYFCLGTVFLCLGRKDKESDNKNTSDKK